MLKKIIGGLDTWQAMNEVLTEASRARRLRGIKIRVKS